MRRATVARLMLIASFLLFAAVFYKCFPVKPAQASSKSERELGATVFHEKGCEHCHGVDGMGTDRGPALGGVGRKLHPAQIAKQIHDGGEQMPAFGDALTSDEIQHLVAYLSAKKQKPVKSEVYAASSGD